MAASQYCNLVVDHRDVDAVSFLEDTAIVVVKGVAIECNVESAELLVLRMMERPQWGPWHQGAVG